MPQEFNLETNIVHLEGTVCSCKATQLEDDAVKAEMKIWTAKTNREAGVVQFTNPMLHRVVACADGEKGKKLFQLEQNATERAAVQAEQDDTMPFGDIVSVDGKIAANKIGQPFVLADDGKISFPKKLTLKNSVTLQGKVTATASNVAYASAKIAVTNPANKETNVEVPVCISCADNPKKYAELSQGRVKPGEIMSVKGPLVSKTYSAGDKKMFVCSVNIDNYEILSLNKTKKKKNQMGI